jgi:hypothetical protein
VSYLTSAQLAAAQQKETQRMAQEQELIHRQSETLSKAQCEIEVQQWQAEAEQLRRQQQRQLLLEQAKRDQAEEQVRAK